MRKLISVLAALGLSSIGLIAIAAPASAWTASASASSACEVGENGYNTGSAVITGSLVNGDSRDMNVTMNAGGGSDGPKTVAAHTTGSFRVVVGVPLDAGTASFPLTWTSGSGSDSRNASYGAVSSCPLHVYVGEGSAKASKTICYNDKTVTLEAESETTAESTESQDAADKAAQAKADKEVADSIENQLKEYPGWVDGECVVIPPTLPPVPPTSPPAPPVPPTDYCPDLEGVQWEGYDCVAPTPTPTESATVVPTPEPTVTPTATPTAKPTAEPTPEVTVPSKPVIPNSVPAGDGSSLDTENTSNNGWEYLLIGLVSVAVFAAGFATARLTSLK